MKFKKLLEGFRFNEMKKEQDYLEVSKTLSKGQIISKWFFGVFDFLQKTNENKSIRGIIVVKSHSFVRFLEEIEDIKTLSKLTDLYL